MSSNETMPLDLSADTAAAGLEATISERMDILSERGIMPNLVILTDGNKPGSVIEKYVDLKTRKGLDFGIHITVDEPVSPLGITQRIAYYNETPSVHGIVVQLPIVGLAGENRGKRESLTTEILRTIDPKKDVDGLGHKAELEPATPLSILSMLEANGIDYLNRPTLIRGKGRLVGAPLLKMMKDRGAKDLVSINVFTPEAKVRKALREAEIIITATGAPVQLHPHLFPEDTPKVVIDAGTAEQRGVIVGDVSDDLRSWGAERGWRFTPKTRGIGRLTVLHLLSNAVTAAERSQAQQAA